MKCVLKIPLTEDWDRFPDLQSFLSHVPKRFPMAHDSGKLDLFLENVGRWSDLYDTSYTAYRHQLKQISLKNWDRLPCEKTHLDPWTQDGDTAFLVMDDDDWFNPAVVEEVERAFTDNPDLEIVWWDAWQYRQANGVEEYLIHKPGKVGSNSFAIRGGFAPKYYISGAHAQINKYWDKETILYLPDRCLSLWNIHPASVSFMSRYPVRDDFHKVGRAERPAQVDWAAEEIEALYALTTSMKGTKA